MVNIAGFPDAKIKVMFAASYYWGKVLEWIQPYIIEYMEVG